MRAGLIVAGLSVLLAGHLAQFAGHTVDDAYISARYASNWAAGQGLVFNPGERVEGYSNFLLVAAESLAVRLGANPIGAAKSLGAAAAFATLALLWRWLFAAAGPAAAGLACLLFALAPAASLWSVAGLEGSLQALWLLMWVGALARACAEPPTGAREIRAGLVTAVPALLAALTRPEGAMFLAANAAVLLLFRKGRRAAVAAAVFSIVTYGSFLLWRHGYYGEWLPNTFQAKVMRGEGPGAPSGIAPGLSYLGQFLGWGGGLGLLLAAVPAFVSRRFRRRALIAAAPMALQVLFILAVGGDWMIGHRFIVPAVPALCYAAGLGLARGGRPRWTGSPPAVWLPWLLAAAACALQTGDSLELAGKAREYSQGLRRAHVELGKRLAREAGPGAAVAVIDAGAIPFFSGLPAVDMLGLTNRAVAAATDPSAAALIVLTTLPEYVVLTNQRHDAGWDLDKLAPLSVPERSLLLSPAFHQRYQRVSEPFQYVFAYYELVLMKRGG